MAEPFSLPRSSSRRRHSRTRRTLLRKLYFGAASFWGCICGFAGVAIGLDLAGRPIEMDQGLFWTLIVAILGSVGGGVLISLAYRELLGRNPR